MNLLNHLSIPTNSYIYEKFKEFEQRARTERTTDFATGNRSKSQSVIVKEQYDKKNIKRDDNDDERLR